MVSNRWSELVLVESGVGRSWGSEEGASRRSVGVGGGSGLVESFTEGDGCSCFPGLSVRDGWERDGVVQDSSEDGLGEDLFAFDGRGGGGWNWTRGVREEFDEGLGSCETVVEDSVSCENESSVGRNVTDDGDPATCNPLVQLLHVRVFLCSFHSRSCSPSSQISLQSVSPDLLDPSVADPLVLDVRRVLWI